MSLDTYRYLFSALIQVFGALIAIGGIFIVWKFGELLKNIERLKKRLGRFISFVENDIEKNYEANSYSTTLIRAEDFLTFTEIAVSTIVVANIQKLKNQIEDSINAIESKKHSQSFENQLKKINKDRNNSINRLQQTHSKLKKYLSLRKTFKNSIWQIMGIPAFLTILFSMGIIWGEKCFSIEGRLYASYVAILFAFIGLFLIINKSSKSFIVESKTK